MTTYIKQCIRCEGYGYVTFANEQGGIETAKCVDCNGLGATELVDCPLCTTEDCKYCGGSKRIKKSKLDEFMANVENGK